MAGLYVALAPVSIQQELTRSEDVAGFTDGMLNASRYGVRQVAIIMAPNLTACPY